MAVYRLYYLDNRTGRIDRHEQFEASDDDAALEFTRPRVGDRPLELWSRGRKVAQFEDALAVYALDLPGRWTGSVHGSGAGSRRLFTF